MLLEDLAPDLVEVTSQLIGGRTVNIMNTEGIIVASTEKARIGTLHQGALEAVRSGKPVVIEKGQLDRYPGAKEGYNMPLRVNGSIIGAVGVKGEPAEIQDLAHLLEVYATKCYQVEAMVRSRMAEGELRERTLRKLLSPKPGDLEDARELMGSIPLRLEMPVTVAVVSFQEGAVHSEQMEKLIGALLRGGLLDRERDLWGAVNDRLVLILSGDRSPAALRRPEFLEVFRDYRLSFGSLCRELEEIRRAWREASVLDRAGAGQLNDMGEISGRCAYMLAATAGEESAYLDGLYQKLCAAFSAEERRMLLSTVRAYYEEERSVGRAAQALFIHKNTLQYRVRRLLEVLELTKCSPFQQEYLIRLLLERQNR